MNYRRFNKKRQLRTIDEDTSINLLRPVLSAVNASNNVNNTTTEATIEPAGSEENIPESQEQTQRFLSQRSMVLAATLGRTQSSSRVNCSRQANSYFELELVKAGVQLDEGDTFVLPCDHIAIVAKLRDNLVRAHNYPENVYMFKTGLSTALSSTSKLAQKLLTGCTIDSSGEDLVYQSQSSMFVNFLIIDFLREPCLAVLLDKIEEVACSEREQLPQESFPMLPLMLAQLRFVTFSHSEEIYERIKSISNHATHSSMLHIIGCAEFLLDGSKHDEFVDLLISKYANSKQLFQVATVQAFGDLSLNARTQDKLRTRILAFVKEGHCPNATLPHLVRLLLNSLKQDGDEILREIVGVLREIFNSLQKTDASNSSTNIGNDKPLQLELFNNLQVGLIRSKRFYQMWQKTIASLPSNSLKSFDLIMLLLLIHVKEDNEFFIENILRRHIKLEHITVNILSDAKTHYSYMLELLIGTLMNILHDFMREKNPAVAEFAKSSYSILFKICGSIQKNIIRKLLELACDKSVQNSMTMALSLLCDLQRKYAKDMQNWATMLLPLLERLGELTLSQTRMVMELVCRVAHPADLSEECSALQEQVDMLVKKQLINSSEFVKKQGIIGCVQLIDAIARVNPVCAPDEDLHTTIDSISGLPEGRGKQAANLLLFTQSSITHSAESLALFYDEMESVFNTRLDAENGYQLDKLFISWLCELMTHYFQQNFITEHQADSINGIKLDYLKCINQLDESCADTESEVLKIGINIAELIFAPDSSAISSILVLAPLFNFMGMLHMERHENSLEAINALLGCALVLPSFFDSSNYLAIFDNYDAAQQKQLLYIYFQTVNWMRVTICRFATQRHTSTRQRVLVRLHDLIKTEQMIKVLLSHAPVDFAPPPSEFRTTGASAQLTALRKPRGKPSGKRGKCKPIDEPMDTLVPNELGNQTRLGDVTVRLAACKSKKVKVDFEQLYGPLERYRQLSENITMILDEPLSLHHPLEAEEVGTHLGLPELRFILTDLVEKLDAVVNDKQDTNVSSLKPMHFMSDISHLLHNVVNNFESLAKLINEQLEKVNQLHSNLDLFTEHFNYVKVCFGLTIQVFALFFSWSGWSDKSLAMQLMIGVVSFFPPEKRERIKKKPVIDAVAKVFNYFLKYEPSVLTLNAAVQFDKLLRSLRKLCFSGEDGFEHIERQTEEIREICGKMLRRKWYHYSASPEKGAQCNIYLDELVKGFFKNSSYIRQKHILRDLLDECQLLNTKDKALNSFPNFKKANFPLLFRGLCETLTSSLSAQLNVTSGEDRFKLWESNVFLLNGLLDIVQTVEQPRNFVLFLRHAQLFLKLLLKRGLSVLESTLRENAERIGSFLRNLQTITRFLHQLCCHSKYIKNTTVISYIPALRETVEALVFQVKALLAANKCHSVFAMGNLINKDLHGDAIVMPMVSYANTTTEANSDEEIPEDDASVDETVLGEEMTSAASSSNTRNTRSKSSSRSKCF
ncbi:Fanconi anemia group D2 protein isoform X2 [Scaptodrosophila lebanonensis]|uniref:Fanconi anemia group D2 protein isoform X2 n=1 Tax=Drosophila lebanonensis TaxID=7225 RepID=A0A6J2T3W2_DROLE|nr:Fanconi anemia group D2 protein isoform X2 [Scaptodrosophila lebanonensis]